MNIKELEKKIQEIDLTYQLDEIKEYIMTGMIAVTQFHFYHLFVKNGSHHEALKSFYVTLQDELDSFTEGMIANYNLSSSYESEEEDEESEYEAEIYFGCSYDRIYEELESFKSYTNHILGLLDGEENLGLKDKLIDIQEAIDKLLYKLQLS